MFTDRNAALAYDASLSRRAKIVARIRSQRPLVTDTGRVKEMVEVEEVVKWLTNDATWLRTVGLV